MRKLKLVAATCGLAGILSSGIVSASTIYGSLSNFDVFNDSPNPYYGFEIELEGLDSSSVAGYNGNYYTYSNWHYGMGSVSSANGNTLVRYYNGSSAMTSPYNGSISATDGHTCITVSGCEHFGVALNGNPTATRYYWLDQNGDRATQVSLIGMPSINVIPQDPVAPGQPAPPPIVQMQIEAPEAAPGAKFSDAVWVKIMKTELDSEHMAALDDLMADNPDKIADANDPNAVEVEWKILQRKVSNPDAVQGKFLSEDQAGASAEQVLRTYQFFAFAGEYDPEHEAICGEEAGDCEDVIANFLQENSGEIPSYVGRLIGQQMVAVNLNGPIELPPALVPVPGAIWLFGSVLMGWLVVVRRKA
ncbi:MAG: hypothetical protein PHH11_00395 [Methylomonas sp.]|nr:hypothetical protein [Methylomonas sp.]